VAWWGGRVGWVWGCGMGRGVSGWWWCQTLRRGLRYHHESTFAGAGMAYARGQVLTEGGRIVASFTQDSMIRAFTPNGASKAITAESRL
jgi:hypothetical protein